MKPLTGIAYHQQANRQVEGNKNHGCTLASLCCRSQRRLGLICTALSVPLQYPSSPNHRNDHFSLGLSHQPHGTTRFVKPTAKPTDANAETPPKALRPRMLCSILEIRHSAEKQTKAAQQLYKRHHDSQVRKENCIRVGQLVNVDVPTLSTCTADKKAVVAYSKLLLHFLGPYHVTLTTLQTLTINQDGVPAQFPLSGHR